MQYVLIATAVILAVCAINGLMKGLTRKASGILAFVLSIFLVNALLPTVTTFLKDNTPVYSLIKQQCQSVGENLVASAISQSLSGGSAQAVSSALGIDSSSSDGSASGSSSGSAGTSDSGTGSSSGSIPSAISSDGGATIDRDKVKAYLQGAGYDSSVIDSMTDDQLKSLIQQYAGAYAGSLGMGLSNLTAVSGTALPRLSLSIPEFSSLLTADVSTDVDSSAGSETGASSILSQLTDSMSKVDQTKFIESLPLPTAFKEQMETFNNSAGYAKLEASDFGDYIISYFATIIMNVLAYVVTMLVVWIIIRAIIGALGIFSSLPIIRSVDRIGGLALGLIEGVLLIWILFLVLSLFSATPLGTQLMNEIYANPFLQILYNTNIFMNFAAGVVKGIL